MARSGYSLLQMSIVLVIIGLVIGGIVVGSNMIRQSELESVEADVRKFNSAIYQFQTKYGALPGDLTTATSYWSTTTNGDGNGYINYNNGGSGEEYVAWQHLGLAGFIPGTFTGAPGTYTGSPISLPQAKVNNGYYRVSYQTGVYNRNGHLISLNDLNTSANVANKAILSAYDVSAMDRKFDDGLAATGDIMGFNEQGVPGCVSNDYTVGSGTYISSSSAVKCKIFFWVDN